MIVKKTGDLLSLTQGILVHGCNCQGVMGAGIALAIKKKWNGVYRAYQHRHQECGLQLGDTIFVSNQEDPADATRNKYCQSVCPELPPNLIVANAMTQYDCGNDPDVVYVDYDAVTAAFARIGALARATDLPINFPLIGCGLANGKWERIAPRIEEAAGDVPGLVLWVLP